jgi:hypothetical protein
MNKMDRRTFLTLTGAGSLAAGAGVGVPGATILASECAFAFRAVAGLPQKPLPSYASYVVQGHVDLQIRSGFIATTVVAGEPGAMSDIALPGLSRVVRVTDVVRRGKEVVVQGVIDDRWQLMKGESPEVEIRVNRADQIVHAPFFGNLVPMRLVS